MAKIRKTKLFVLDALGSLPKPYTEDVTDEVFEVIENDPQLLDDYWILANDENEHKLGQMSLNQSIGSYVKKITGREVLSQRNPCKKTTLAKTYSKLIEVN